jgi:hydrogenase-4 component E
MSAWVAWTLAGLALGAVGARRQPATVLVAAQTVLVGVAAAAMAPGRPHEFAVAAGLLVLKGVVVVVVLALALVHTRESRPHDEATGLVARLGGAVALALALAALLPAIGPGDGGAGDAAAAMLAAGFALVLLRRPTAFAVLAFLIAENAVAVAALSVSGGLPLVVELGAAFDVVLVIAVAAVLQRRILAVFGTTDPEIPRGARG